MLVRVSIILTFCFFVCFPCYAADTTKIVFDDLGNISAYWLAVITSEGITKKQINSLTAGAVLSQPILEISREVVDFDLYRDNGIIALVTETNNHRLFFTSSNNNGWRFSLPQMLNQNGQNPRLACQANRLAVAWEKSGSLELCQSGNNGSIFEPPLALQITGEIITLPQVLFDNNHAVKVVFVSQHKITGQYSIWQENPRQLIYRSYDKIDDLHFHLSHDLLIITWQEQNFSGWHNYYCLSLDQGLTYGNPQTFNPDGKPRAVGFPGGRFAAITFDNNQLKVSEIPTINPPAPLPATPTPLVTNNKNPLLLSCSINNNEPTFYQLSIAPQAKLNQPLFSQTQLPPFTNSNVTFTLSPETLAEGKYYWQVSANNGTAQSPATERRSLIIDNTAPNFSALEAERQFGQVIFRGCINSSPAWLAINNQAQNLTDGGTFTATFELTAGLNNWLFRISDEAGNLQLISREVYYDPASPEVVVTLGDNQSWFKAGAAVLLQAIIHDPKNIIEDKESPLLTLPGEKSEPFLVYDEETGTLSGFITLPKTLPNGKQSASLTFHRQNGDALVSSFTFNIGVAAETSGVARDMTASAETIFLAPPPPAPENLLISFAAGPNPFSPARELPRAFSATADNKGMVFAYSLIQPADIKIRIYDITGTLIWVKEINGASSGFTPWSGTDQAGQIAANGIYPYFFTANNGGQKETRRGKIVIYQ